MNYFYFVQKLKWIKILIVLSKMIEVELEMGIWQTKHIKIN